MLVRVTLSTSWDVNFFPMELLQLEYELLKSVCKCSQKTAEKTGKNIILTVDPWYEESEVEEDGK